ncbi:glycosyltransferase family 2 protein, partial [Campylobacter coli]|nr:glycosyltransferase family 2 protein [Campylobacter coli]
MQTLKISILIPSFNSAKYIKECLESVIHQTLKDIEIICIDANSNDGTLDILESYAKKDNRIKIILSNSASLGYQLNLGIASANAKYISIVESDDYADLSMCEKLWNLALLYDCDMIKADIIGFKSNKTIYLPMITHKKFFSVYGQVLNPSVDIIKHSWTMNQSGIYKLDFIKNNKIKVNETLGASYQDFSFWFLMISMAKSIYFHREALYYYRQDNQSSSVKDKNKVYCVNDECKYVEDFLIKNSKNDLIQVFYYKKFKLYIWNLNRIDKKYALEFLKHFSFEFG